MVSEVVQCIMSNCDDVGIVDVNFFGGMVVEEERINKEVQSFLPRSKSFAGVSKN